MVHPYRKFINFEEDKTKLNLEKMYKKAMKLSEIVANLRKKIEVLEGKYDFLEFCNKEFGENNKNIMNKLQKILDKKQTLESFFSLLINNFFPNMKLVDNTLPVPTDKNNNQIQNNNQISDMRNKEIVSQLFKIFNLNDNNTNNNISVNNKNNIIINNNITGNNIIPNPKKNNNLLNKVNISTDDSNNNIILNKNKINQIMEQIVDKDQLSTESREIKTYNKIMDFQKQYFKDLEEQNTNNFLNISKDSQNIKEIKSIKSENELKNDKDVLNVTSNNDSLNKSKDKIFKEKSLKDDATISDGSKDLL